MAHQEKAWPTSATWRPRGTDLTAQLPGLLAQLERRLGPVRRIGYNIDDWSPTARSFDNHGHPVRLDGSRETRARTVDVTGVDGDHLRMRLLGGPAATDSAEQRWESEGGAELHVN